MEISRAGDYRRGGGGLATKAKTQTATCSEERAVVRPAEGFYAVVAEVNQVSYSRLPCSRCPTRCESLRGRYLPRR
jgi:hypothetical protein